MKDYDKLVRILGDLFDAGGTWGDNYEYVRARAIERAISKLEDSLDIEWTHGEITAICGKELT